MVANIKAGRALDLFKGLSTANLLDLIDLRASGCRTVQHVLCVVGLPPLMRKVAEERVLEGVSIYGLRGGRSCRYIIPIGMNRIR